jgi:hypothetical protein
VLTTHGAETFLDQEHLEAGDLLPDHLREGIAQCNRFLLLWSWAASQSTWVHKEWDFAWEQRKRILPYVLDDTPLPDALANLVHVDAQDRNVSPANLLTAIFGKAYKPSDPTAVFRGLWRARLAIPGLGDATYDVELRKNGQLAGSGSMGRSGIFAQLAGGKSRGRASLRENSDTDGGSHGCRSAMLIPIVFLPAGRSNRASRNPMTRPSARRWIATSHAAGSCGRTTISPRGGRKARLWNMRT